MPLKQLKEFGWRIKAENLEQLFPRYILCGEVDVDGVIVSIPVLNLPTFPCAWLTDCPIGAVEGKREIICNKPQPILLLSLCLLAEPATYSRSEVS